MASSGAISDPRRLMSMSNSPPLLEAAGPGRHAAEKFAQLRGLRLQLNQSRS
jgi:hypothetical protein